MRSSNRSRLIALVRGQWAGLLALFLVLAGGTAYAVDTVGSSDIIDKSIQSVDVKNGQVRTPDLATSAVTSAKIAGGEVKANDLAKNSVRGKNIAAGQVKSVDVKDNSVGAADIAPGTIPAFIYTKEDITATDNTPEKELSVKCDGDDTVIAGGYEVNGATAYVLKNDPLDDQTWLVRAQVASGTPSWQLTVTAVCAF